MYAGEQFLLHSCPTTSLLDEQSYLMYKNQIATYQHQMLRYIIFAVRIIQSNNVLETIKILQFDNTL